MIICVVVKNKVFQTKTLKMLQKLHFLHIFWKLITISTLMQKLKYITSVIRQKGESQNGCLKKTKQAKFSKKRTLFTPWYAHVSIF